ncbi:hypothetical protein OROMI_019070 [Orobanche minor]
MEDSNNMPTKIGSYRTEENLTIEGIDRDCNIRLEKTDNTIDIRMIPREGMEFSSHDDAYNFYNQFSLVRGFSIRKSDSYKSKKTGEIIRRKYCCNKEGYKYLKDKREEGKDIKRRRDEREGCRAELILHVTESGIWKVKTFSDNHNHEMILSPNKKINLRSHDKAHMNLSCKNLMDQYHSIGIGPARISRLINVTSGDSSNNVTSQQCTDYLKIKRKNNIGKECMTVIHKFMERQASDPEFYYAIEISDDQVCRSAFWADGRARKSYLQFHDVIVFDVTYRTNNFSMPFAPFTGVNHHTQSILFGCALLADEKEETFTWLFKQWLNCMWGKYPGAIITDQDPAIKNAIAKVFPKTHHRFCSWHISLHENEHLRSLRCAYNPEFDDEYTKWTKKSKTIEESERHWCSLIEKYKHSYKEPLTEKHKNEVKAWNWLESMHQQRYHWVKAYLRGTFFAGMKASSRSESMNAYFDGYVNSMTPLSEFIKQYDKAVLDRREKEEKEDLITMRTHPDITNLLPLEAHAAKIYTRNVFEGFTKEFKQIIFCRHKKLLNEGDVTRYEVYFDFNKCVYSHSVEVQHSNMDFKCSCSRFEFRGILCKHILYIMKQKFSLNSIPEKYILPRWTLGARHSSLFERDEVSDLQNHPNGKQVSPFEAWNLRATMNKLYDKVICHTELYDLTCTTIKELWKAVLNFEDAHQDQLNEDVETNNNVRLMNGDSQTTLPSQITIRDPSRCKTKGRPRVCSRILTGMQASQIEAQKQIRTCKNCKMKGHYASTCKNPPAS